jgi:hypothetical protein
MVRTTAICYNFAAGSFRAKKDIKKDARAHSACVILLPIHLWFLCFSLEGEL